MGKLPRGDLGAGTQKKEQWHDRWSGGKRAFQVTAQWEPECTMGPGLESARDRGQLFSCGREKQEARRRTKRGGEGQTIKDLLGDAPEHELHPGGKAWVAQGQSRVWDSELGQHWEQTPGKGNGEWQVARWVADCCKHPEES